MRQRALVAALFSSALFGVPAAASDLKVDGQVSVAKALGAPTAITVAGGANEVFFVLADVSAGPTFLLGESVPLGFTPATLLALEGSLDGDGIADFSFPLTSNAALVGTTFYLLAVVADSGAPFGVDFSNGADVTLLAPLAFEPVELAGNSLPTYPHFEYVRSFNEGAPLEVALDPGLHPQVAGQTVDLYVTAAKTAAGWDADPSLVDVSGGAETVVLSGVDLRSNRFTVDVGTLSADAGAGLGVGYDVVVDVDRDGLLGAGDFIDGYGDEPGLFAVHDVTQPGPYAVEDELYSGGAFLGQIVYYPSNIASLGEQPLVVVSHGNGHNYLWYDHIGEHLASYGFVVMSHQNDTVPGIGAASGTTLTNTDYFLANLDTIAGGVLQGHVNRHDIIWIGHSRGGEGVARAYDKILDGTYVPTEFTADDILLISSIAPTDFKGPDKSNPHGASYHLWVGGADADVSGCVASDVTQSFHLLDRAENQSQSISLHGVGHGDFHDGGGSSVASGPCKVGRPDTHTIMRGYMLPLFLYHLEGNLAAEDFLWRQWESFRPIGAPLSPCVVVDLQFKDSVESGKLVVDDFQTNPDPGLASSGATVTTDLVDLVEERMDDGDSQLTHNVFDDFNGFTMASAADTSKGIAFTYDGLDRVLAYAIPGIAKNWTGFRYLSFRATQGTRHPLTQAELGDHVFEVRLTDADGDSSTIAIDTYGGGIEEPYQRSSCGSGVGWSNEMETVRLRLRDFLTDGSSLDLARVAQLEFLFGPSHGNAGGRLGLDDIELTTD